MKIYAVLFSEPRKIVGYKEIEIEIELSAPSTVEDVLKYMILEYGDDFKHAIVDEKSNHYKVNFSVNRNLVQASHTLSNGDRLTIFPVAGGG